MPEKKKHPLWRSFGYAFQGIGTCIKKERNMKIHCLATIVVIISGTVVRLSVSEWCICILLCGVVMALELINTAIEAAVDLVTEEKRPLAKVAKDTAAGAVLIMAIAAAVIGFMIFVPYFMNV